LCFFYNFFTTFLQLFSVFCDFFVFFLHGIQCKNFFITFLQLFYNFFVIIVIFCVFFVFFLCFSVILKLHSTVGEKRFFWYFDRFIKAPQTLRNNTMKIYCTCTHGYFHLGVKKGTHGYPWVPAGTLVGYLHSTDGLEIVLYCITCGLQKNTKKTQKNHKNYKKVIKKL
jgi:hypothetical protein